MKLPKQILHINASEMRDYLTLKQQVSVADGEGGFAVTLSAVKGIYARVELKQESRVLDAAQLEYTTAYKIYCRYDSAINNDSILTYRGLDLTIHSCVNLSGLNRYFEILAYSNE